MLSRFASNSIALSSALSKALSTVHSLAELAKSPPFNMQRFETFENQILNLPLPELERQRNKTILDRVGRYVEFGEFGAVSFELKLLSRNLQKLQASEQFRAAI